jgi:hypothetical protein
MDNAETMLITTVVITLLASLLFLIAIISMLRQWRNYRYQHRLNLQLAQQPVLPIPVVIPALTPQTTPIVIPSTPTLTSVPKPQMPHVPENYRLSRHNSTPDQVILSIEPQDGPTRDQLNVQKLIDFLKQEIAKPAPVGSD